MEFRNVCKINLVTAKLFSLETLHYGTIQPTALHRGVCPSGTLGGVDSGHCIPVFLVEQNLVGILAAMLVMFYRCLRIAYRLHDAP